MNKIRIIPRIDLKNNDVVKGYHLEGWKKIGDPIELAHYYYNNYCDEIIFIDSVASLFSRKKIIRIIKELSKSVFVPITIGGGIRSMNDVDDMFHVGADKIAINTVCFDNIEIIRHISKKYGSQSIVLSIQAKKFQNNKWLAFKEAARDNTHIEVKDWIKKCENIGVGELLITSIDNDGCENGLDLNLYEQVKKITNLPIIAGGGFGSLQDITEIKKLNLSGIAIAKMFHSKKISPFDIKKFLGK